MIFRNKLKIGILPCFVMLGLALLFGSCSADSDEIQGPIPTVKYTVKYDANAGKDETATGAVASQTVTKGQILTIAGNAFVLSGKYFTGWNDAADGTGTTYMPGEKLTPSKSLTLYAQWETAIENARYVTFKKKDGSVIAIKQVASGSAVEPPADPTKEGATFAGWYLSTDGGTTFSETAFVISTEITENLTLYANWKYTVKFNSNAAEGATVSGMMNEQIFLDGIPQKLTENAFTCEGCIFNGWNTARDGSGTSYLNGQNLTPTESMTLYAQWLKKASDEYEVSFDLKGASGSIKSQLIKKGQTATRPETTPTLTGYTFAGWFKSTDGGTTLTEEFNFSTPINADITLYAKWNIITYKVTFVANGGSGTMAEQIFNYGEAKNLTQNTFEREEHIFNCWNTLATPTEGNTGTKYSNGQEVTLTADLTLYAQWLKVEAGSRTITFDLKGGSGNVSAQVITGSEKVTKPSDPEKTGHTFAGWYTSSDNGETLETAFDFNSDVLENLTLYAKWTPNEYTVTFMDGSEKFTESKVIYGNMASAPTDEPVKAGHSYKWYEMSSDGVTLSDIPFDFENTPISGDLTLYTKWTVNTYDIICYDEDGSEFTGKHTDEFVPKYTYNQEKELDKPVRDEFVFVSWHLLEEGGALSEPIEKIEAEKFAENVKIYAKWHRVVYNVSSEGDDATGKGSVEAPFASLQKAVSEINTVGSNEYDYTVAVSGKVIGTTTIGTQYTSSDKALLEEKAKSLTIRGKTGNTVDSLDGNEESCVLRIYTQVPVTVANLKITNGNVSKYNTQGAGAGITVEYGAKLTLDSGALITGNKQSRGGSSEEGAAGVYCISSTFVMNEGAKIIENNGVNCTGGLTLRTCKDSVINGGEIGKNTNIRPYCSTNLCLYGTTLELKGGTISGTDVSSSSKIGVHMMRYSYDSTPSILKISGNAYIPLGVENSNYVAVGENCFVCVAGELTAETPVATIVPSSYKIGTEILKADEGVTLTEALTSKFAVLQEEVRDKWYFDTDGKLALPVYNLTYKNKGGENLIGTLSDDAPLTHTYGYETILPEPVREGYIFQGWYEAQDCSGKKLFKIEPQGLTNNLTLYAKWSKAVVIVSVQKEDVEITKSETDTVVTLTAQEGFKDYAWLIDGKAPSSAISGASVSADGKTLTFNKANLVQGTSYVISVSAKNSYDIVQRTSLAVKKQEAE